MENLVASDSRTPPQVVVYRFGQIGDTVAAVPALWALRRQYPDARILLLSEVPTKRTHLPPEAVLPVAGLIDAYEKYPAGTSVKSILAAWKCIRRLCRQGFRTIVYLVPTERTKKQRMRDLIFFRLAGMKTILASHGFSADREPRQLDGTLIPQPHEADALLTRLQADGIHIPAAGAGCMDLKISASEHQRAQVWWREHGDPPRPNGWIAICPSAKVTAKLWPLERYAQVVEALIKELGVFPVVVGGPEDRAVAKELLAHWQTGLCAAGELSVRESAALLADARLYLGNDTGAMHLAAAVGTPCVAVFSARDWPGKWVPYGPGHQVLRFDVPCAGSKLEVCDIGLPCLTNISVAQVYAACVEVLLAQGSAGALAEEPR